LSGGAIAPSVLILYPSFLPFRYDHFKLHPHSPLEEESKMTKVEATQAQFSQLIASVVKQGERVILEQEGQAIAAVVSYADLKRLEALDDAQDLADLQQSLVENDAESYTVEEVIAAYNDAHGTDFTVEGILNERS
jgi:antitoxin (DNA-binding transcriptional repressor) of toxin-antitoxin stability system